MDRTRVEQEDSFLFMAVVGDRDWEEEEMVVRWWTDKYMLRYPVKYWYWKARMDELKGLFNWPWKWKRPCGDCWFTCKGHNSGAP